jgi:hypothetical protein
MTFEFYKDVHIEEAERVLKELYKHEDKERQKELEKQIENVKKTNRYWGSVKGAYKKALNKTNDPDLIEHYKKKIEHANNFIADLENYKDEMKMYGKEENFRITINNGFQKYKKTIKQLLRKKDPGKWILENTIKDVQQEIKDAKNQNKSTKGLNKLLTKLKEKYQNWRREGDKTSEETDIPTLMEMKRKEPAITLITTGA